MKLTALLLVVACLQVSAEGFSQKISLSEKDASLSKVFEKIEKQSGYTFAYTGRVIREAKAVSIDVSNASLDDVLRQCFQGQPFTYSIIEKTIVVKPVIPITMLELPPPISIIGQVTDKSGLPVPGVSIRIKGTSKGTITDVDGKYSLQLNDNEKTLVFTCVGMKKKEVEVDQNRTSKLNSPEVKSSKIINVVMELSIENLDEVAVVSTGYQTISKERATGSFNTLSKDQIEKPSINIGSRLLGSVAGMQVKFDVNNRPSIEMRGQSTLFANSTSAVAKQPLVIVDGFPISASFSDIFGQINPNDVESVTTLSDAAAASIWGARAANGVIVITTKKATNTKPIKVEFSLFTQVSPKFDVGNATGLATSQETVDYEVLAFNKWAGSINPGTVTGGYPRETQATLFLNETNLGFMTATDRDASLALLRTLDNRSQISDYLLSRPVNTQYNLSVSGSGPSINYRASILSEDNNGYFAGSKNKKNSLHYNSTLNIFKWLDLDLGTTLQYEKDMSNGVGTGELKSISPYQMLVNPDGSLADIYKYYQPIMNRLVPLSKFPYSFKYNPIQEIASRSIQQTAMNIRIQAGLNFKLAKGLTYNTKILYENNISDNRSYQSDSTFYVRNTINTTSSWNQQLTGTVTQNIPSGGFLDLTHFTTEAYTLRNQLNYSNTFSNVHEINIIAGSEIRNLVSQTTTNPTAYGYNDNTLQVGTIPNAINGSTQWMPGPTNNLSYTNYFAAQQQRWFSAYANASYTYLNKYTLSGSYRIDGNNTIAKDPKSRYSPFYSLGLKWQLANEAFMKRISWIDRLNLRITYGRLGNNDQGSSYYPLLSLQSSPNVYTQDHTATLSTIGNSALTWEKTGTLNLGLDYAVLGNKLFGKIEVYNKQGTDLMANRSTTSVDGTETASFNNAALLNRGIEVTIGTALPLKGNDIIWNLKLNAAYNTSRITKLYVTTYLPNVLTSGTSSAYREGYDPNTIWAYQYAGLVNNVPMIVGPGGTFLPIVGSPSIDGRTFMKNMGTRDAPYLLGVTNSFKVYDFNLSFIVTAKWGNLYKAEAFNYPKGGYTLFPNSKLSAVLNGDPNKILPMPSDLTTNLSNYGSIPQNLDYLYLNAGVVRLQEVSLSYDLPKKWLSRVNIQRMQLVALGNNLFSIFANKTGEDPEYPIGSVKPKPIYTFSLKFEL